MSMTVEKFLGEVVYDPMGQMLFAKSDKDGFQLIGNVNDIPEIVSVRGWGAIQHLFKTEKEATEFQDKLGQFMADAINDRVKYVALPKDPTWEAYSKKLQSQIDALNQLWMQWQKDWAKAMDENIELKKKLAEYENNPDMKIKPSH